jgi:chorismate lyase/3-hydroxybenzoate synthase
VYHPRGRASRASSREAVSQLFVSNVLPEHSATLPPLQIGYERISPAALLAQENVLAVIGFDSTPARMNDPRYFQVGLDLIGDPLVEVWRANGAIRDGRDGRVRWSSNDDYGFFAIEVEESGVDGIATAAEQAYRDLTACIDASPTPHVLRLWNYFDAINLGDGDDERYRHFCVGRARAMAGAWRDRYPAATAIGRRDGVRVLQVYALTARLPGVPVENPRQVNAWRYPREYGPTPPTFARGMTTPAGQLLISGTAAVVGAKSRHADDVAAQLDETLTNIASLIGTARASVATTPGAGSLLKAYVRERADAALISARLAVTLGEIDGLVILNGDICRRELLVEIDGLHV